MRYDIILFDADGTLFDFARSEDEALREAMALNGIEPTADSIALYSKINDSLWKMLERREIQKSVLKYRRFELLLKELGVCGDAHKMANDYVEALSKTVHLLDGAEDMCRALVGKARLYIVTNGIDYVQRGRFARCGIKDCFDGMFISDAVGVEKPCVEYFDYVAAHVDGFDKSRAVIVGDSLTSDMRGGINYGIDTCWYNPEGKPVPAGMSLTCVANSFDGVLKFICGEDTE